MLPSAGSTELDSGTAILNQRIAASAGFADIDPVGAGHFSHCSDCVPTMSDLRTTDSRGLQSRSYFPVQFTLPAITFHHHFCIALKLRVASMLLCDMSAQDAEIENPF
jgi:hypothetical protein